MKYVYNYKDIFLDIPAGQDYQNQVLHVSGIVLLRLFHPIFSYLFQKSIRLDMHKSDGKI